MIEVTLYSRRDCHLCDQAQLDLEALASEIPHRLIVKSVDEDPKLQKEYGFEVPVLEAGPYKMKAPFTQQEIKITLLAAQHREAQIAEVEKSISDGTLQLGVTWTSSDRFSYWLSKHYLFMFNAFCIIYLLLPHLAPVLLKMGAQAPASFIYRIYGATCHQLAYRSWFLFGEQSVYPLEIAGGIERLSYEEATGMSGDELWEARQYTGDDQVGYKVALCERDVAIYLGILVFGLIFAVLRLKIPPLHWMLWILLGILPIALDGFSQLLSRPPFELIPMRESTPLLRTLTGLSFGIFTAWFGYPIVEKSMQDTRRYLDNKISRLTSRRGTTSSG